jgi:hypothetical protein
VIQVSLLGAAYVLMDKEYPVIHIPSPRVCLEILVGVLAALYYGFGLPFVIERVLDRLFH